MPKFVRPRPIGETEWSDGERVFANELCLPRAVANGMALRGEEEIRSFHPEFPGEHDTRYVVE